jgi:ABC-type branched-chain amino acid transport systems, ATPase component
MSNHILKVENLVVQYGSIRAVKGVSMEVETGSIVAILGANGAGKSSFLRAISGMSPVTDGKILFEGQDITALTPEKIVSLGISQSPEGRRIFPDLTVNENLMIGAFSLKDKAQINKNLAEAYELFPQLAVRKEQMAGTLSGGEQQMLAIARAQMSNPKLLILDEPSLGLAPLIVRNIFEIIQNINKRGTTVLIVEQNALQTLKIAHYAYVLEVGSTSMSGAAQDLLHDQSLINSYLGG